MENKKKKLVMSIVWFFLCLLMLTFAFGNHIFDFMGESPLFGAKHESSVFKSVLGAIIFLILGIHELAGFIKNEG